MDIKPKTTEEEERAEREKEEGEVLLRRNSIQNLFNGYDFDVDQEIHKRI